MLSILSTTESLSCLPNRMYTTNRQQKTSLPTIRKSSSPSVAPKIKTTTAGTPSEAFMPTSTVWVGESCTLPNHDTGEYRKEFIYIESSEEDRVPRKYYHWNEIVEEGTPSISDYCIPASSLFTIQYPTLDSEIPGFTLWLHTSSSSVMADSR